MQRLKDLKDVLRPMSGQYISVKDILDALECIEDDTEFEFYEILSYLEPIEHE